MPPIPALARRAVCAPAAPAQRNRHRLATPLALAADEQAGACLPMLLSLSHDSADVSAKDGGRGMGDSN